MFKSPEKGVRCHKYWKGIAFYFVSACEIPSQSEVLIESIKEAVWWDNAKKSDEQLMMLMGSADGEVIEDAPTVISTKYDGDAKGDSVIGGMTLRFYGNQYSRKTIYNSFKNGRTVSGFNLLSNNSIEGLDGATFEYVKEKLFRVTANRTRSDSDANEYIALDIKEYKDYTDILQEVAVNFDLESESDITVKNLKLVDVSIDATALVFRCIDTANKNYDLLSLVDISDYILTNKTTPGINPITALAYDSTTELYTGVITTVPSLEELDLEIDKPSVTDKNYHTVDKAPVIAT